MIDPVTRRAVNVSSSDPVAVDRQWLSGEMRVKFAVVVGHVMCVAEVTCVEEVTCLGVHVTGVSLRVEEMDGAHLNGRDSLVILQRGMMEGKRVNNDKKGGEMGKRRYVEFMEKRRERRERKLRREGRMDVMFVIHFVVSIFAIIFYLFRCS